MTRNVGGIVLAASLAAVVGWPTLAMVREAVNGSGPTGAGGIVRPLGLALETLKVVGAAELIALPLGTVLALLLTRTDLWGRRVMLGLTALAVFVPMPLHALAWLGAFGNVGRMQAIGSRPLLVGWLGAAIVHAIAMVPWVVLLVGVGLRSVEPELEEAALLDMPAWRVMLRVTLRRSLGAIAASALAVAVLTAGDMTVTDLVQPPVRTYAEEVYTQTHLNHEPAAAAVVALPPLLVLGLLVVLGSRWLMRADPARIASAAIRARLWRLGRWRVPLGLMVTATLGNLFALPIYALAWRAGRVGGSARLGTPPHWSPGGLLGTLQAVAPEIAPPLLKSLVWASVGASLTVLLAWPLAWATRRAGRWRWVAAAAVALILATPGPLAGMALVLAYRDLPVIYDTPAILTLAYALRTLPYALLVLWPALRTLSDAHLDAAALDGHGLWGQVRTVALPLTLAPLAAAWGVSFVLALGELPAALVVEPPSLTPLLTVRVWSLLHTGVESHLAGVGLVLLGVVGAAGLATAWVLGWFVRVRSKAAGSQKIWSPWTNPRV